MIAVAVFTIVAGAAFTLFDQQVLLATKQQNLSSVNIGLRNAMAQLEMDLAAGGQNLLSSVPLASAQNFSLGVIVQNSPPGGAGVTACTLNTTNWSYPTPSACFDSLTILYPKPCSVAGCPATGYVQVLQVTDASDNLNATTTMNAGDPVTPGSAPVATTDAGFYKNGDELLVITPFNGRSNQHCPNNIVSGTSQSQFCMTVVTLTANATTSGANIVLTHSLTGGGGQPQTCPGAACTDPLGLVYSSAHAGTYNYAAALTPTTSSTYIVNMGSGANDVWYTVAANPANANDPQLMRCMGAPCTAANEQALTDQVIGFKAGAILWGNNPGDLTDLGQYMFDASTYCNGGIETSAGPPAVYVNCSTTPTPAAGADPYDYTLVQALRISMLARTTPISDATLYNFKNAFDGGHYLVQQASVVVDLRSMSNTHFAN